MSEKKRCTWAKNNELLAKYHDEEWGIPIHEDKKHYEHMVLESAQAGLSWLTVLKKRDEYKKELSGFEYKKVAKYTDKDIERMMKNTGLIRNRQKLKAAVINAKAFLLIQKEFGSFDKYIWGFVSNKQIQNKIKTIKDIPAKTEISDKLSKDLKKRGFSFVGSTTMYAHMQALGVVNDHELNCFRRENCNAKTMKK